MYFKIWKAQYASLCAALILLIIWYLDSKWKFSFHTTFSTDKKYLTWKMEDFCVEIFSFLPYEVKYFSKFF